MVVLRYPIYLELARSESGQGLIALSRVLAPPLLETAAMPACLHFCEKVLLERL